LMASCPPLTATYPMGSLSVGFPTHSGGSRNAEHARRSAPTVVGCDDGVDAEREFGVARLQRKEKVGIEMTDVDGRLAFDAGACQRQLEPAGDWVRREHIDLKDEHGCGIAICQ